MVKDTGRAKRKMARRIRDAVPDYREGLELVKEDPVARALEKIDLLVKRLQEAIRTGKLEAGLKEAVESRKWFRAKDKMVRHYEEVADEIADEWAKKYDGLLKPCLEKCLEEIKDMPEETRSQRIQKSAKFQECMGNCIDQKRGVKSV